MAVLEEYAGQVKTLGVEEVKAIITQQITIMKESGEKLAVGLVLKALFSPGGALDGKPADRKEVAGLVTQALRP